jgi:alkanesulfonate monooxygenase SsuD/methylene tetrahydromethanopterin reductase-like flavin-dependent oxidoreductase (luciferase family)
MKSIFFHMQGYRDLPGTIDDFREKYPSVWTTLSNSNCDPKMASQYAKANFEELLYADELGFDGVGTNEHHQNGYGYPMPHLSAAILASHGVKGAICLLGTTLPLHHPMMAAEELATIDVMSEGRLVTGWVTGTGQDTTANMGIAPTEVRPRFFENHDFIKKAWTTPGPFAWNGRFIKQRHVNPWPQPIQDPHPPIWMAGGNSLESFRFAAENNYPYTYVSYYGLDDARSKMQFLWDTLGECGCDDNPYRAGFAQLIGVAETDEEAKRLYWPHMQEFTHKALHIPPYYGAPPGFLSRQSFAASMKAWGGTRAGASEYDFKGTTYEDLTENGMFLCGSPETVARKLEEGARELRFGHLLALMQWGSMGTDLIKSNLRLYAEEVMPKVTNLWPDYEDHWWPSGATVPTLEGSPS